MTINQNSINHSFPDNAQGKVKCLPIGTIPRHEKLIPLASYVDNLHGNKCGMVINLSNFMDDDKYFCPLGCQIDKQIEEAIKQSIDEGFLYLFFCHNSDLHEIAGIIDINMTNYFDFDDANDCPEYSWVMNNAELKYYKNSTDCDDQFGGVCDFIISASSQSSAPPAMAKIMIEAQKSKIDWLLIHMGG
jgi:hypothetical protein